MHVIIFFRVSGLVRLIFYSDNSARRLGNKPLSISARRVGTTYGF